MNIINASEMECTISKNKVNYIRSLERKKERIATKCFIAEGPKVVNDLLGTFHCRYLAAIPAWLDAHSSVIADEICKVSETELSRASLMKTPQQVLAIFDQRVTQYDNTIFNNQLCLALDNVQNPGNLGTIVRMADWFGIEHVFCSLDSADIYNPKAVQATMGAFAHVQLHYVSLVDLFQSLSNDIPIYGTLLNGNNIYSEKLSNNGIIVMGNEGRGLRTEVEELINHRLYIPNYPQGRSTTDSLNVAVATAIVCAEFRRQSSY
jgi:TrmH family RNA methyltransferase